MCFDRGFLVLPKTKFCVSGTIIDCGTLVLTYGTAPSASSMSTMTELCGAGLNARAAMPMHESTPAMLMLSLKAMGRPCRGPRGWPPWVRRCSSREAARARAWSKKISVRQLRACCAMAALCVKHY
jgi:hypothetical protein